MNKTVKLGDVCDLQNGYAFKSGDYVENSNTLNIRMSNIRPDGNFNEMHKIRYLPDSYAESYKEFLLNENDLIIAMTDMAGDPKILGMPTLVKNLNGRKFLLNQRVGKLHKFSEKIYVPYLFYFLKTLKKYYKDKGTGGLQINISKKEILSANIVLKPITEQKRIVAKLDRAFAEIEKKNEIINHNIKNAKKLKIEFITKQLNKLSKADFKKLSSICVLTRGPFGGSLTKAMFVQNGYAVYEQKHAIRNNFETVKYFISEEKFNEMKRFELRDGDLLMSCSGTLGKIAIVPKNIKKGIINQALLKITPNEKIISKEYLKLAISSDYFQKILSGFSMGAAQTNVPSVKILKNILIPVPNIDKQKEILKKISLIEDLQLENLYKKKKNLVESLKSSIVSNLIN